jgi:hypothetical protein
MDVEPSSPPFAGRVNPAPAWQDDDYDGST